MKFLTFLNSGCLDICLNMLKSAENVGINMDDFMIACMDEEVYNSLSTAGYKGAFLYMDQQLRNIRTGLSTRTVDLEILSGISGRSLIRFKKNIQT